MRGLRVVGLVVLLVLGVGMMPTTAARAADCEVTFSDVVGGTCEGKLG